MARSYRSARMGFLTGIALWVVTGVAAAVPAQANSEKDYTKEPGYFDFEPVLGDQESSVDILLKGSLLVLAREAVKDEDPELGTLLSKIEYVRIQILPARGASREQLLDRARDAARRLEKRGWEMAVRAREDGDEARIYWLPGDNDAIRGLVVMAVENDDEAAFINIVGTISPAEIGRIAHLLRMDSMDIPIKVEVKGDAQVIVDDDDRDDIRH